MERNLSPGTIVGVDASDQQSPRRIPVDAGGIREIGVVDTQGGILFQVVPEEARRLVFSSTPRVVGRAIVGGGAPVEVKEARLAGNLRLGRHVFHQPSSRYIRCRPTFPRG
jgi:hypothetical protein